jgi:acetyl esterase/lipase
MKRPVLSLVLALAIASIVGAQDGGPVQVSLAKDIPYGLGGDMTLLMDLYRPKQKAAKPFPVVIQIHGGAWAGGDKRGQPDAGFLRRGIAVAKIDYRLSNMAPFPAALEDCKCAVRFLRANAAKLNLDPDRIGVTGESAGAHLALLVACVTSSAGFEGSGGHESFSSRVACAVSFYGETDLTQMPEKTLANPNSPVARFLGGLIKDKPDLYRQASPIEYVAKDSPPILFIHGDKDTVVPLEQSERMLAKLKEAGVEGKLIVAKNGMHDMRPAPGEKDTDPKVRDLVDSCEQFFADHLGSN